MICFYEGENVGFGIAFNEDYNMSRLTECEFFLKSKYSGEVFKFKKTDNSLIVDSSNPHILKALLPNSLTLGKAGAYLMQIRLIDSILGEKKTAIGEVFINKAVALKMDSTSTNSDVMTHIIEVSIADGVTIIERYNLNVLGVSPKVVVLVDQVQSGAAITHNLNCFAVRAAFYYNTGEPEFQFLYAKDKNDGDNKIECIFPTDDLYTGRILIEKLF